MRAMARKLRRGIDDREYSLMFLAQEACCAICLHYEDAMYPNGRVLDLAVDHDHESGKIRGLLCNSCNRGLGFFRDSPTLLMRSVRYLEKHGKTVAF